MKKKETSIDIQLVFIDVRTKYRILAIFSVCEDKQ